MSTPKPARARGRPPVADTAHRLLAEVFRRRIRDGTWPPGAVIPPWRTLAREHKVSARVVQLACESLKQDGLLAATPQRRLVACDPRSPGLDLSKNILVLLTSSPALMLNGRMYAELLEGILRGAGECACPVQIAYDDRLSNHVPRELLERPCLGIVLVGKVSVQALKRYAKLNVPVVLADHPATPLALHTAGVDNRQATRLLVERLAALGHRRIAFLRRLSIHHVHQVDPDAHERQRELLAAVADLADSGRGARACEVFSFFPNDGPEAPAFRAILNARKPFSAVIAGDPGTARFFMQAAQAAGRRVPQECSVLAYATLADAGSVAGVGFDFREVGRLAARLAAQPQRPPQRLQTPGRWLEGPTLAPAP